jgi:phenol 2-monooxygenase
MHAVCDRVSQAAQGMNTSMHDSWNLAFKLALVEAQVAKPALIDTYELERRKIAQDLITFDREHARLFTERDPVKLAKNFESSIRFISGVGADYQFNILNAPVDPTAALANCKLVPGQLVLPARATRYIDACVFSSVKNSSVNAFSSVSFDRNPVDLQLDIGWTHAFFRIYLVVSDLQRTRPHIDAFDSALSAPGSFLSRFSHENRSPCIPPPIAAKRYHPHSDFFTFGLLTTTPRSDFELADLPPTLRQYGWGVYVDDRIDSPCHAQPIAGGAVHRKWGVGNQGAVIVVRPDGYIGCVLDLDGAGERLGRYFSGFLLDA